MTIHEVEYTSCEDGLEDIVGFQIRAMTRDAPRALVDIALRDSVYLPGPDAPDEPTTADLGRMPVCFGYTPSPDHESAVLYRSVYVGTDHTGRWGNYFVHGIVLPAFSETTGPLPIDLYESSAWQRQSVRVGFIASATAPLPPGELAAEAADLTTSRLHDFGVLLAAVRQCIAQGKRLIVVTSTARESAQWIWALSRSLDRHSVLGLSFTTYTARPEQHRAMLTFTTPDVVVSRYGNHVLLDLAGGDARDGGPSDYDVVVSDLWRSGDPGQFLSALTTLEPALATDEADVAARLFAIARGAPDLLTWNEAMLLDTLSWGLRRAPQWMPLTWRHVADVAGRTGGFGDVSGWGQVLRDAARHGHDVPQAVNAAYVAAALEHVGTGRVTPELWLPDLDAGTTRDLGGSLSRTLAGGAAADALLTWLSTPARTELREAVLDAIEDDLVGKDLDRLVDALPAGLERISTPSRKDRPRTGLAAVLADVRTNRRDAADVLAWAASPRGAALRPDEDLEQLATQLWQTPPSTSEALRLLKRLPESLVVRSGLIEAFTERLIENAAVEQVSGEDAELAKSLKSFAPNMSLQQRAVVASVEHAHFFATTRRPLDAAGDVLSEALSLRSSVGQALRRSLEEAVTEWVVHNLTWEEQANLIADWFRRDPDLVATYQATVADVLPKAPPELVAQLFSAWIELGGDRACGRVSGALTERTLPEAMRRKSRRFLDEVAEHLDEDMANTWSAWRTDHERVSLTARITRIFGRES